MPPINVTKPKQLLVEGKDSQYFFHPFIETLNITGIEIQNYGGITDLPDFLGQLIKNSDFRKLVIAVGITRDAEDNSDGAFQSICSALTSVGLSAPRRPLQPIDTSPKVNVFIFPGGNSPGMLESLLLQAVSNDPAVECIDDFFSCIEKVNNYVPRPLDKAKTLAYLASREKQIIPLTGNAARAGYWNFDNPAYDQLKGFIRSL